MRISDAPFFDRFSDASTDTPFTETENPPSSRI
jgi:hypothetical protein